MSISQGWIFNLTRCHLNSCTISNLNATENCTVMAELRQWDSQREGQDASRVEFSFSLLFFEAHYIFPRQEGFVPHALNRDVWLEKKKKSRTILFILFLSFLKFNLSYLLSFKIYLFLPNFSHVHLPMLYNTCGGHNHWHALNQFNW